MRNAPIRARILQPDMAAKTGHGGGIRVSAPMPGSGSFAGNPAKRRVTLSAEAILQR
jgi:hypothetical protein